MKAWIEKPVSEPPELHGYYLVINENYAEADFVLWHKVKGWQKFRDKFTHYLLPTEGNFLTDAEIEKIASDAWDAGMRYGVADERSSWGTKMPTNKTEYLKSIKHDT